MGRSGIVIETVDIPQESIVSELQTQSTFGFREVSGKSLVLNDTEGGADVSDIISFLAARSVKIAQAGRKEASLEELYATILEKAEADNE
jgi:hypothetical protein